MWVRKPQKRNRGLGCKQTCFSPVFVSVVQGVLVFAVAHCWFPLFFRSVRQVTNVVAWSSCHLTACQASFQAEHEEPVRKRSPECSFQNQTLKRLKRLINRQFRYGSRSSIPSALPKNSTHSLPRWTVRVSDEEGLLGQLPLGFDSKKDRLEGGWARTHRLMAFSWSWVELSPLWAVSLHGLRHRIEASS